MTREDLTRWGTTETLIGAWEEHIGSEFAAKSSDQAIETMSDGRLLLVRLGWPHAAR